MPPEVSRPPVNDLRVRIERLDSALMHASFEVLLRFFVRKGTAGDSPERALRREISHTGDGYPERRRGVGGEVGEEIQETRVV